MYKNQRSYPIMQQRNVKLMSISNPVSSHHYSHILYALMVNHAKMSACCCGTVCEEGGLVEAASPDPGQTDWTLGLAEAAHLCCVE